MVMSCPGHVSDMFTVPDGFDQGDPHSEATLETPRNDDPRPRGGPACVHILVQSTSTRMGMRDPSTKRRRGGRRRGADDPIDEFGQSASEGDVRTSRGLVLVRQGIRPALMISYDRMGERLPSLDRRLQMRRIACRNCHYHMLLSASREL